jgi:GTP 3',8-cyclase
MWANHKLRLIVSSACNLDCFYCHNEGQRKWADLLRIDLFEHVLRLAYKHPVGLERATLSGGEPLLHPRLEYFVRQLAPLTSHRTIVTNGLLLNERRLDSLRNAGVSNSGWVSIP